MKNLYLDFDLTSDAVRDACTALGIGVVFAPSRSPCYKGTIENTFNALNALFTNSFDNRGGVEPSIE